MLPVTSTNVTVAATAGGTRIAEGSGGLGDASPIAIYNPGTASVFVGGSGVTTANGIPIGIGSVSNFSLSDGEDLYAIVATVTTTVSVMRGRQ